MKQLLLNIQPPAAPGFDNFIPGQNQEALASLQDVLSGVATTRFIYLWGEPGSGKSHLLLAAQAMGAHIADDVHTLDEESQIILFDTYNQIKAEGGMLVTAGSHAPTQMDLRDDLATRLAWGLVYQLHPLSDDEKADALRAHARERGMKLPDEVIAYCLRYLRRDLPTLMAVLEALDEWSLTTKKAVTLQSLRKMLQDSL
ncbi:MULTISPECIES: HdaA/DnaA family protein [Methylophilus]|uniref:HdaA/DnaA family protein n=1 Tax=Methylophilus TaxID=16 RepID=UPI000D446244|nr:MULTISPECIES: DnaA/Hda family protein [Methylophilus]PPD12907.1 MAG: DnaA regulatory inactivator Hda [Methylophilus sp.]